MSAQQAPERQATERKTPLWKKRWFWIVVGAVVVLGIIVNLLGGGRSSDPEPEQTPAAEQIEANEDEAEESEPAPVPEARPVAEAEVLWLEMHGVSSPLDFISMEGYENDASNPLYAIQPGWGGSTNGYLEITVQEPLNNESVKRLGINVLNFIGPEFPDIDGIVFTDSNGLDYNFYRRDAPLADKS